MAQAVFKLVICSITRFRNRIPGCNYPGTRTRFQVLSKKGKTTMQWHIHAQLPNIFKSYVYFSYKNIKSP